MKYLTAEERKEWCEVYEEGYTFKYIRDLSHPIIVVGKIENKEILARAITIFIGMWMWNTHQYLNGFSGLSTVKYEFREEI